MARAIKLDGPAIVSLIYDDEDEVELSEVTELKENPDGSLEIWQGDTYTKVRPSYRYYQVSKEDE